LGLDGGPNNNWVLTLDSLIVGLDAAHSPLVQWHDPNVRCSQVRCGHGSRPAQPKRHVCSGMCQPPCRQLKHYMGAGVCPTLKQEPKHHVCPTLHGHGSRPAQPKRHVCSGMCQPPCRQLKHYMGARVCPTLKQEPKHHVYTWYTQHTGKQPKRPRLGRPSARWLQPGMRLASVACPTPKPGYQASGVRSTLGAP